MRILVIAFIFLCQSGLSQIFGEISGTLIDALSDEPIEIANVWVDQGGSLIGSTSDINGRFRIKPLSPGTYDVHIKDIRYTKRIISAVVVNADVITVLGEILMSTNTLQPVEIIAWEEDLIRKDDPSKISISAVDIIKRADSRTPSTMIASLVPGVTMHEDGKQLHFRGSRPQNMATFIDGVKYGGGQIPNVPANSIQNLVVYTGGIPASYGDITGGVVVIETKSYMDFYRASQRRKQTSKMTDE